MERQVAPWRARARRRRLEPGRRLHRRDGAADLVGRRRSGHDCVSRSTRAGCPTACNRKSPRWKASPAASGCRPMRCARSPAAGVLQRVGDRAFGSAKVVYEVLASPFEDGTEMARGGPALSVRLRLSLGSEGGSRRQRPRAAPRSRAGRPAGAAGRAQGRARGQDNACHRRGLERHREDAGAGGLSPGRAGRRAAGRGAGPAMEHGALASAGADGGSGRSGATPRSRRKKPRGGRFPGSTWSAIGRWERSCRT